MKRIYSLLMTALVTTIAFAQEKSAEIDINVNKDKGGGFWGSPWMWVVGAAVFILLLVAILRRGGSRE